MKHTMRALALLAFAVAFATTALAQSTNVTSRMVGGNLVFYDKNGTEIFTVNGSDRASIVPISGKCTILRDQQFGPIHQTALTLTLTGANDLDLADGDHGTGIKIADFPAGRIAILGVTVNASVAHNGAFNASPNDVFNVSAGSVIGADDNDLTSTEVDLVPKTALDTVSGATSPLDWKTALVATAQFDGTTTAVPLHINAAVAATANSGATTYAITGTLTVTWVNLGDY